MTPTYSQSWGHCTYHADVRLWSGAEGVQPLGQGVFSGLNLCQYVCVSVCMKGGGGDRKLKVLGAGKKYLVFTGRWLPLIKDYQVHSSHLVNVYFWVQVDVCRVSRGVRRSQKRVLDHVLPLISQCGEGLVNWRQQV